MSNRLRAQDLVQGPLQRWHRDPQPLEAPGRGQGPELQQPLGEAFPTVWVGDQHHLAAVGLHGPAALLGVELVVDQHHRRQVVASRQLGHQPMHPRLGAKARRTGRHLGDVENAEALWVHRSGSLGRPGTSIAHASRTLRSVGANPRKVTGSRGSLGQRAVSRAASTERTCSEVRTRG